MSGDTIFALASGRPPAGVAVVRVSGPEAGTALCSLTGAALPPPRRAVLRRFYRPEAEAEAREPIDEGIALWFPAPASSTGEDVCELHVHGGRAVIAAVCDALLYLPGLRPAEPGEFSRRAFAFGKMDLTQAEALADLVAAETEAQRAQARRQFAGALGERLEDWRARLIGQLARVEAGIDFADEDIPADLLGPVHADVARLKQELAAFVDDRHRGERLRDGVSVAILGAPNVGKSRLMNRLARRDVAIVAARAGTTRDVIEVRLDLSGLPVILADTAGLRETADEVEAEGVRRARARAAAGDLKLCVFDARALPALDAPTRAGVDGRTIVVLNKIDLIPEAGGYTLASGMFPQEPLDIVAVSAKTGEGVANLEAALASAAAAAFAGGSEGAPLTRTRHRAALTEAVAALERVGPGMAPELLAEELRLAAGAIGRITGRIDVEDVLDAIFSEFCIGK